MSEDAKKLIEAMKNGTLPPLSSTENSKGTQVLQHGLDLSQFEKRSGTNSAKKEDN